MKMKLIGCTIFMMAALMLTGCPGGLLSSGITGTWQRTFDDSTSFSFTFNSDGTVGVGGNTTYGGYFSFLNSYTGLTYETDTTVSPALLKLNVKLLGATYTVMTYCYRIEGNKLYLGASASDLYSEYAVPLTRVKDELEESDAGAGLTE